MIVVVEVYPVAMAFKDEIMRYEMGEFCLMDHGSTFSFRSFFYVGL